jgi:hypothetical protein
MTTSPQTAQSSRPRTGGLIRAGAISGAAAAVSTTAVAAIASAAGASLEVDAQAIPLGAFAWWTVIGTAVGVVLARLLRNRRRFITLTVVALGLSLIPPLVAPDDTATKLVLVGAHLLAAAIVIPGLGRRLAVDA